MEDFRRALLACIGDHDVETKPCSRPTQCLIPSGGEPYLRLCHCHFSIAKSCAQTIPRDACSARSCGRGQTSSVTGRSTLTAASPFACLHDEKELSTTSDTPEGLAPSEGTQARVVR